VIQHSSIARRTMVRAIGSRVGFVVAAWVTIAAALPASAQDLPSGTAGATVATIVTTGESVVARAPDVAYVMLSVESRARMPREAQRQNAALMNTVQTQIAMLGIPRDAQRTMGLWLDQEFDNVNGRRVGRDFVARNTLEVRIDEVARAGEIADAVVQAGATSLNGIRFDLKDRAASEREALRLAVADARARSDAAAAGAGRSVDRILKIEESRSGVGPPRPVMTMRAEQAAGAVTAVEPGLIEIRAVVTLTAAMK